MSEWYRLTCKADDAVADLSIFGEIGGGWFADEDAVTGKKFAAQLDALPETVKTIRVRVNSPGGAVFDAVHIANALRRQSRELKRTVEMEVEALAASAATIITSAGDAIKMPRNAVMMIHMPSGLTLGSAASMRKMADALDKITDSIVATYRWVSPLAADKLRDLMQATTWMNADEALENGFITEVSDAVDVAAALQPEDFRMLGAIPEALRARLTAPAPKTESADPKYVLAACEGLSPKLATVLMGLSTTDVDARITHAREVAHLCAIKGLPELAEGYMLAHTPVAVVREHVTTVRGRMDRLTEVDGHRSTPADERREETVRISAREIYQQRNSRALPGAGR